MRVALVNPNTSTATTDAMVEIARAAAPPWLTFEGVTVDEGASVITEPTALAIAAAAVVKLAHKLAEFDAVIVSAFGDPGREQLARILSPVPVIGIGEASMAEAAKLSNNCFAVATTTPDLRASIQDMAAANGLGTALVGVRTPDGDAATLMSDARKTEEALAALIQLAVDADGARAVIIGGGPLALAARALAPRFRCPIVEPIPVAVARTVALLQPAHSLAQSHAGLGSTSDNFKLNRPGHGGAGGRL